MSSARPDGSTGNGVPMLVLMRRVGETLMIGLDVSITILAVKGSQIRVGINAPRAMPVHRREVFDRIRSGRQHENAQR